MSGPPSMWSEAGPQAAAQAQGGVWGPHVPLSEHPRPGGLGCGHHPGSWRVHPAWRSDQEQSWTSDRHLLPGGCPVFCAIRALLCRGWGPGPWVRFCISLQLRHHGRTVRLRHWLEPLTVLRHQWDDGEGKGVGVEMRKQGGWIRVFNSFTRTSLSTLRAKWVIVAGKRHNCIVPRSIFPSMMDWEPRVKGTVGSEWVRGTHDPQAHPFIILKPLLSCWLHGSFLYTSA